MNSHMMGAAGASAGSATLWGLVLTVHLLGMATWIGGGAYALFVLNPSLRLLDNTQRVSIQLQTLKRYFLLVWHAMPLVLISGWLMLFFREGGFANPDWHLHAMQGLGLLMAAVFLYAFFGPFRKARRAIRPQPALFDRLRGLVTLSVFLGILVVIDAALDHNFG
ncbi:CopD family protein [Rhizosaccharibacter radicis]|uniref:CopD family protein n=1 Tax=Rhizosaccharibacter radicis TaxID=2782605 RepID=A0ABT1VYV7_9PROT|nr:CopD family protein [Acetobacteraceae bacterium KSS12]